MYGGLEYVCLSIFFRAVNKYFSRIVPETTVDRPFARLRVLVSVRLSMMEHSCDVVRGHLPSKNPSVSRRRPLEPIDAFLYFPVDPNRCLWC